MEGAVFIRQFYKKSNLSAPADSRRGSLRKKKIYTANIMNLPINEDLYPEPGDLTGNQ
jgi:hypothetical protein